MSLCIAINHKDSQHRQRSLVSTRYQVIAKRKLREFHTCCVSPPHHETYPPHLRRPLCLKQNGACHALAAGHRVALAARATPHLPAPRAAAAAVSIRPLGAALRPLAVQAVPVARHQHRDGALAVAGGDRGCPQELIEGHPGRPVLSQGAQKDKLGEAKPTMKPGKGFPIGREV